MVALGDILNHFNNVWGLNVTKKILDKSVLRCFHSIQIKSMESSESEDVLQG